ncbi:hypothetical protein ABZX92_22895, partial [Lentzea sp. NPDC006480]|uniref:hypothetical protein n=1 Tax=Lentzea sp. NPDC006480 TaxID=3157176 RepID=UPI0033A53A6F
MRTGYAIDSDSGYVIGIDGGTLAKRSVKPLADSQKAFNVHPTSSALFVVEHGNRVVQAVHPDDISTFGAPMELPASGSRSAGRRRPRGRRAGRRT